MRLLLLLLFLLFLPFDDVFLLALPVVLFVGFIFFFLFDDRAVFVKLAVFTEDVEEAEEEVVLEGAVFGLPDDELAFPRTPFVALLLVFLKSPDVDCLESATN